jgi:hypothetical protein
VLREQARPAGSRADPLLGVVEVDPDPVALDEAGLVTRLPSGGTGSEGVTIT